MKDNPSNFIVPEIFRDNKWQLEVKVIFWYELYQHQTKNIHTSGKAKQKV